MGKEDGAGPVSPHQGVLFAEMGRIGRHHGGPRCGTTPFPVMPVHQAVAGTEIALAQDLIRRSNLRLEQPPAMRLQITGSQVSMAAKPLDDCEGRAEGYEFPRPPFRTPNPL